MTRNRGLRTTEGEVSVIAHRGGSGTWRENTLEAFAGARSDGADGVELDARLTRDGTLVVHHDAALETGETIEALSRRELPDWIPDLTAAVAACDGMLLDVEIKLDFPRNVGRLDAGKSRAIGTALAESLGRSDGSTIVSSFWPDALIAFSEAAAGFATGLLVHPADDAHRAVTRASNLGCSALHPFYLAVDPSLVERCHQAGLEVGTWTVNSSDDVRSMVSAGVDAVITDQVSVALGAVGRRQ
ncbi:MAG: glycerophosphodiester phosphodiesterase [Acidimicrobiales bacterium]